MKFTLPILLRHTLKTVFSAIVTFFSVIKRAMAQNTAEEVKLNDQDHFEMLCFKILVFSHWANWLFSDSKMVAYSMNCADYS